MSQLDYSAIMLLTELVAEAVTARLSPAQDIISTRQAEHDYGRSWLRIKRKNGEVKTYRMGASANSVVGYSRHELSCLWHADHRLEVSIVEKIKPEEHNAKSIKNGNN